jgi:hypothetical protein
LRNRLFLALLAVLTLALCTACQAGSPVKTATTVPSPAPRISTAPPRSATIPARATTFTWTGSAVTASGAPVPDAAVGFKLVADIGSSCGDCGLYTAVTNTRGTYAVTVPAGQYEVLCARTGATCQVLLNPPQADIRITVSGDGTVNFLVSASAAPSASTPPVPPSPVTTTPADQNGDVVSGHIYTASGQPYPNADITFREAGCPDCMPQPHVTTGPDGSYSITLQPGVYNAECDIIGGCGEQGASNGDGVPVNIPPGGTLNFVACPPNSGTTYPQCLQLPGYASAVRRRQSDDLEPSASAQKRALLRGARPDRAPAVQGSSIAWPTTQPGYALGQSAAYWEAFRSSSVNSRPHGGSALLLACRRVTAISGT